MRSAPLVALALLLLLPACAALIGLERTVDDPPVATVPEAGGGDAGESQIRDISAGGFHTCILTIGGQVRCWGANNGGQIGDRTNADALQPVDVFGLTGGVTGISSGVGACAVLSTGEVRCWGANARGQIGDGTTINKNEPTLVKSLPPATKVAMGTRHTCAVAGTSDIYCWGDNTNGQLGDGTTTSVLTPKKVEGIGLGVSSVGLGYFHSCVVIPPEVFCWGDNSLGSVGDGTFDQRTRPVQIAVPDPRTIVSFAAHTCAVSGGGALSCWGNNKEGEVGDGTKDFRNAPVVVRGFETNVKSAAVGCTHTCALTHAGEVSCWGENTFGQLGDGTLTSHARPGEKIDLGGPASLLTAGCSHTCAALQSGRVRCWGQNAQGQLGDGTREVHSAPVDVVGL